MNPHIKVDGGPVMTDAERNLLGELQTEFGMQVDPHREIVRGLMSVVRVLDNRIQALEQKLAAICPGADTLEERGVDTKIDASLVPVCAKCGQDHWRYLPCALASREAVHKEIDQKLDGWQSAYTGIGPMHKSVAQHTESELRARIQARPAWGKSPLTGLIPPGLIPLMTHDELVVIVPVAPSWRCAGHSCPDRAPARSTTAPTCYTCGRTMARLPDTADTEHVKHSVAGAMKAPLAERKWFAEPDLGLAWHGHKPDHVSIPARTRELRHGCTPSDIRGAVLASVPGVISAAVVDGVRPVDVEVRVRFGRPVTPEDQAECERVVERHRPPGVIIKVTALSVDPTVPS